MKEYLHFASRGEKKKQAPGLIQTMTTPLKHNVFQQS